MTRRPSLSNSIPASYKASKERFKVCKTMPGITYTER
jgi:hypothetical protein